MKGRVLVAGFSTRHVAQSAFHAGYEVCAVDHFCDQDLTWYTKDRIKFEDLADLPDALEQMSRRYSFDMLIVTSGAEQLPSSIPLRGTPREHVARFLDKLDIQHFFEANNIPVPRLRPEGKYPAMIKPRCGAGGWRNAVVSTAAQQKAWEALYPGVEYIRQEMIAGIPASVCCVADGKRARAIATNEQILQGKGDASFGFCGSVTPFVHPLSAEMKKIAERIAAASGCVGTVGIDFVVDDEQPHAIEINARFQGTVDTVERALGCNLFQYHLDACAGILPSSVPDSNQTAIRSILFAERDCTISADLKDLKNYIADIPHPGSSFEAGQALVSVYGWGRTREAASAMLDKHISTVKQYIA
ncbi:MAG: ATP-grasp domain-containing protein [Methanoregula sp.]|nr:ATP-grasp domain-containing protein [Methanoregula sp.]